MIARKEDYKFVRKLQSAYAGELAAYYAYVGHIKSLRNINERWKLEKIKEEEYVHLCKIFYMLKRLSAKPDPVKEKILTYLGKFIGFLCGYTGWLLPMYVAGVMERIGFVNYAKMAIDAADLGHPLMAVALKDMAKHEKEHEEYFRKVIKEKYESFISRFRWRS